MRAFVTGAAGFVGASLVRRLIERGHAVTAAVRDPARADWLAAIAPVGGLIGSVASGAPNFGELVSASAGVTYWFSDAKARVELGYAPRDLDAGLRTLLPT